MERAVGSLGAAVALLFFDEALDFFKNTADLLVEQFNMHLAVERLSEVIFPVTRRKGLVFPQSGRNGF